MTRMWRNWASHTWHTGTATWGQGLAASHKVYKHMLTMPPRTSCLDVFLELHMTV